ncbi:ribosome biogenesis GTPase YlqF [Clostridium sp. 'deep sea']|uniref:ribosome biogenesis GTPase YlqF n=1 Tax=Clostridium sp. 'deep sea' TaxID=2779445 RepID=UPI0018965B2F|nr:ribosome biogenesis GTPase YlqF [Clostridium sp. 'deep sea']QOR36065.1 ribosome biogenesis GTPase YlqF [Clostridium sp. 'deep sea']
MSVQWYPGHMTKAKRQIQKLINNVDAVLELRDARIPISSSNPDIADILGGKPRIIVLNKIDLADNEINKEWLEYFEKQGILSLLINCGKGQVSNKTKNRIQQYASKFVRKSKITGKPMRVPRLLVVGIPNVGKSSLINALAGRKAVRIGAKPGLTRGQQLINISGKFQILDTPGVLWPKINDQVAGIKLAATGAISDVGFALDDLVLYVYNFLHSQGKVNLELQDYLHEYATKRGYLMSGNKLDIERAKKNITVEFKSGKYGRYSLETPPTINQNEQ